MIIESMRAIANAHEGITSPQSNNDRWVIRSRGERRMGID